MKSEFYCSVCKQAKVYDKEGGCSTGYACRDDRETKVCFDCCAREDIAWMREKGRITLYLTVKGQDSFGHGYTYSGSFPKDWKISNWPNTLEFQVTGRSIGRHNWAGRRYDVWFNGPDGFVWHGVQYGDFTQICHCRRTRDMWATFDCMIVPAVRINWPIKTDTSTQNAADVPLEERDLTDGEHAFLTLGSTSNPERRSVRL